MNEETEVKTTAVVENGVKDETLETSESRVLSESKNITLTPEQHNE